MSQPAIDPVPKPEFVSPLWIQHPPVLWMGLAWGFAEATLFFVVPDVLLTLVSLYSLRRSARVIGCILLGALAGGTLMFYLGARNPAEAETLVLHVPFVSSAMFARTQQGFQRDGIWTLTKSPGNGIPYKVYCVQAAGYSRWPLFLSVSALARMERFAPFWLVSGVLGMAFRKQIQRRTKVPALAHVVLWILGYAWYWSKI